MNESMHDVKQISINPSFVWCTEHVHLHTLGMYLKNRKQMCQYFQEHPVSCYTAMATNGITDSRESSVNGPGWIAHSSRQGCARLVRIHVVCEGVVSVQRWWRMVSERFGGRRR